MCIEKRMLLATLNRISTAVATDRPGLAQQRRKSVMKPALKYAVALSVISSLWVADGANAAEPYTLQYTAEGELIRPADGAWREWIYVGAPVTPNALNDGSAPFPEIHSVYIEPKTWTHYKKTGAFMEGAIIAKELSLVRAPDGANADGSTNEVSGTGYFMGEYSGFEITVKSKTRYPDEPGNWAYYSFGHHGPPYAMTAALEPVAACNACHEAAADDDFVFTQFYPVLRAAKP